MVNSGNVSIISDSSITLTVPAAYAPLDLPVTSAVYFLSGVVKNHVFLGFTTSILNPILELSSYTRKYSLAVISISLKASSDISFTLSSAFTQVSTWLAHFSAIDV